MDYKEVCKDHGCIISQCRCPGPKFTNYVPCRRDCPQHERIPQALVDYGKAEGLICEACGFGQSLCKCRPAEGEPKEDGDGD